MSPRRTNPPTPGRLALGLIALLGAAARLPAHAQDAPAAAPAVSAHSVALRLGELASSPNALRLSTRATESVTFAARSDQVLTAASLELPLAVPSGIAGLRSMVVELNGEALATYKVEQLKSAQRAQVPIEAALLGSSNVLSFRYLTDRDPKGCGRVPEGSWSKLAAGSLKLGSAPLPLPSDLQVLPLPFVDPQFDRKQTLHFVFGPVASVGAADATAANLVAAWFALRGPTQLSFETHLGTLPAESAVVLIDDASAAAALDLTQPVDQSGQPLADAVELRAHPLRPDRKLLVLWGLGPNGLRGAVQRLVRDGSALQGAQVAGLAEGALPALAPHEVPRWVKGSEVTLGALPEKPRLRGEGGSADTLRIPFRISPDSFAWPSDHVQLVLGHQQAFTPAIGPAHVHVAVNGSSIGVLPAQKSARTTLRVPRSLLRGFNELLVQISYPERALPRGAQCEVEADARAWFEITPDSRLKLGSTRHFAVLPDLSTFLYDGFPFTEHGDLRETMLVLPERPDATELGSMLGAVAHFTTITGAVPSGLKVVLGTPPRKALAEHDVLLIAGLGRHPLFDSWRPLLPLRATASGIDAQYPEHSSWWRRALAGRFGDGELKRAQRALDAGAFAAVMGVAAPWSPERSLVVVTASEPARMPRLSTLMDRSEAVRARNDLLVVGEAGRGLFQLGVERGRGQLPELLSLRFWLSHYWVVLLPVLLLAALLFALHARGVLARIAARRLAQVER